MVAPIVSAFVERFARAPGFQELTEGVARRDDNIVVSGVRAGALPALLAALAPRLERPILLVTGSLERAETLADGMEFFGLAPLLFPGFETLPFETVEPVLHVTAARWRALARLIEAGGSSPSPASAAPPVLIVPVDALAFRVLARADLERLIVHLRWGEPVLTETLAARLTAMGYRREGLVESPGEFAIRGSIVDVFPPDAEWPWRVDLFGDEIEQIRRFDPTTQRSFPIESEIEGVRILPAASHGPALDVLAAGRPLASVFDLLPPETLCVLDGRDRVEQRLIYFADAAGSHWQDVSRARPKDGKDGKDDRETKDEETGFFVKHGLGPQSWLLTEAEARAGLAGLPTIEMAGLGTALDDGQARDGGKSEIRSSKFETNSKFENSNGKNIERMDWGKGDEDGEKPITTGVSAPDAASGGARVHIPTQSFEAIPSQFPQYLGLFRERLRKGHWIVIACDNNGQVARLDELLRENEIPAASLDDAMAAGSLPRAAGDDARVVMLAIGQLHEGFHCPQAGVFVVTDREIFGRYKRRHVYRKVSRGKAFANPNEIERGDFVVHVQHGIALFEGIRRQQVDGHGAEFLELTYQDGDKLLIPVDKLHLVQKYAGADGKEPALDKLGSKRWAKRCKKSMEAVRKMAGELLELYARRADAIGHAFASDTVWQREFESSFVYQETPDQLTAIEQVKRDMEVPKPMDRLVCGDVGYGKTEVAIRAAFKALVEGRQVAILAPTTLLVRQHWANFTERFADYPFKVGSLSRFQTPAQIHETIEGLASGAVHMVVGTHRLLSKDIRFKDLGLLIVDEEQRFGVSQKERIKSLRAEVDILTLTATPIPRTLYLALSGLRDLSVINTAPADRLPIKTRTIRMDREAIQEALLRELNRGGQVYVIHNRVQSIEDMAQTIREIVPRARVVVAHGQMDEHELEKVMIDFIDGKYDILVSTTIVENGIDIPNVNTMIVNRADAFGLSQLYQLRGRVGRDVRQAYAYLILPPGQAITPAAVKRLEALEEFTDLGVGFSIAMRDLEIRGAGNILGREQHGAINEIGYEMYCRLLEEAVRDLKGVGPVEPLWPTEVKWPVDQFLPENYIPVESQRIRFYKDMAAARTRDQIEDWRMELLDRYGDLPQPALNLLGATRLRLAGAAWRVDTIRLVGERHERPTRAALAAWGDKSGSAGGAAGGANAEDEPLWIEARLKAPVTHVELAVALAERPAAGRSGYARLRRSGDSIVLAVRDDDPPLSAEKLLEITADWLEALPELEAPSVPSQA
jgi:transcription-repair coupling factor (superfamily II helicase)